VLHNHSATGRITEWEMELSGFDLHFAMDTAIKSQVMVDFVAEWTEVPIQDEDPLSSLPGKEDPECWVMYFDGVFSIGGAGASVLLVSPTGYHLKYVVQLAFSHEEATNNIVEYEDLIAGLRIAGGLSIFPSGGSG
jgi:hypothetical protein